MQKKRIAIFASGTGSNAVNLIHFFQGDDQVEIAFVLSNKAEAKVLTSAKELGVDALHFSNQQVADGQFLVDLCKEHRVDWVVLAGYLRLIPARNARKKCARSGDCQWRGEIWNFDSFCERRVR